MNGVFPSPEYNHMSFTRGDAQITQKQSLFVRYAWQVSDFTCEGCSASSSTPWFSGRRHQAETLLVGGRAHVGAVAAHPERGARAVARTIISAQHPPGVEPQEDLFDELARAHCAADGRCTRSRASSWGTSGNFYTQQISRELRDDLSITTGHAHLEVRRRRARSSPMPATTARRSARGRSPSISRSTRHNLASFVPVPGSVTQFATGNLRQAADSTRRTSCRILRRRRVEAGGRRDAEPRACATTISGTVFNQGLTLDLEGSSRHPDLPDDGHGASLAPLVDFDEARRQEQRRSARRLRVGRAQRRQDRRARRLRHLLQPDEPAARRRLSSTTTASRPRSSRTRRIPIRTAAAIR